MAASVLVAVFLGLIFAFLGFTIAFRQTYVRRLIGRSSSSDPQSEPNPSTGDPLTYALRIAGTMMMVFGIAIAGMITLFYVAQ
jgi:hypothetical protein